MKYRYAMFLNSYDIFVQNITILCVLPRFLFYFTPQKKHPVLLQIKKYLSLLDHAIKLPESRNIH